jgi:DNA helicase IV
MKVYDLIVMFIWNQGLLTLGFFVVTIGILSIGKVLRNAKLNKEPVVLQHNLLVEKFLTEIEEAREDYFTNQLKERFIQGYKPAYEFYIRSPYSKLKSTSIAKFKEIYPNLNRLVIQWNEEYVNNELNKNNDLFNNIDGKSLDNQQRRAIVVDDNSNLVLAGAGSGKTLTISAKVKYLVDRKKISPDEILLISFTKKAAEEMYQRISQKLHIQVEAKTFHKLGLDIITKNRKVRPDIAEVLDNVINSYFGENILSDKKQMQLLVTFFGFYLNIPKDLEEFENLGECHDFYRTIDFETIRGKIEGQREIDNGINRLRANKQTIQGETVKSLEELMIANFLYLNGINYVYEDKYPFVTEDTYRKHYRPDFYLPDYNIYIEHFGITKDNRVPWLSEIEEKKYLDGIKWKRETHKKNRTTLLETYSYYNRDGVLLSRLEEILKKNKVQFKERDFKEIYEKVFDNNQDSHFKEFKKLISSFINLFKSNGYSVGSFVQLKQDTKTIQNHFLRQRSEIFLDIVKPMFIKYEEFLKTNKMIDFNDMINEATNIVRETNVDFKYKYIIIDEYQDISMSRFNLINEIRNKTGAKVMCVGDDWQSIYRFAGSDIDLFTNFEKYMGYYELLKIENTYRNSQELINIAGKFIMKNEKQFKKDLKSSKHHSNPIRMITYDKHINQALSKAIEEVVHQFGREAQITILGRNNFDINIVENEQDRSLQEFDIKNTKDQVLVVYRKYPKLSINFLTAHRSKGLEADNVIIINIENKLVGFPNKIADDPILSLVLTGGDSFAFAEERRLFYVALTRTKNTTFLLTPMHRQSTFAEELLKEFKIKQEPDDISQLVKESPSCPRCQKGHLVIRENSNDSNKFLGCSNYPFCDLTFKQLEIINNHVKCNSCGGYMVKRSGQYGQFYGCTNYPFCDHKLKVNRY